MSISVYPVVPSLRNGPERQFIVSAEGRSIRLTEGQLRELRGEIKRVLRPKWAALIGREAA